jgi:hypothetical protein
MGYQIKEAAAKRIAEPQSGIDPSLIRFERLRSPDSREADPTEPVKLLTVSEETPANGIVPIFFGPDSAGEIEYSSVFVEVTPSEYVDILAGRLELPDGWVRDATLFERSTITTAN